MLADGLIDEFHLCVYPLVRGTGPRLFDDAHHVRFDLGVGESYDNGVLYLNYRHPVVGGPED